MKVLSVFLLILYFVAIQARSRRQRVLNAKQESIEKQTTRNGKLFSLFNVVQFRNDACSSRERLTGVGHTRNGTCYTSTECQDKGGTASGNCAAGFGVCCLFIINQGGGEISQNCSYIQNPSFPLGENDAGTLTYGVTKCDSDVCFLRLDFETFVLQGVGGTDTVDEGVCIDTLMIMTASATQPIPTICGSNTGYHMYVNVGANSGDRATLSFNLAGGFNSRMWDIKVTQLECGHENAPPVGCLQYHTTLTGRIETFNFQEAQDNHLNDQRYSICVRSQPSFCCVRYQVCTDTARPFSLDDTPMSGVDDDCLGRDHVTIPQSADGTCGVGTSRTVHSRYCGSFLNSRNLLAAHDAICDCTPPFTVGVTTNNVADTNILGMSTNAAHSRGLCLEYVQLPC